MNGFLITKRKTAELFILLSLNIIIYLIWNSLDFIILFSFGYIWNWAASQEPSIELKNPRRYQFSTLKTVFNLQNLFLKPFMKMPEYVKFIIRVLPAGLFWYAVVLFNGSHIPWWAVFIGSLSAETVHLEKKLLKSQEEQP